MFLVVFNIGNIVNQTIIGTAIQVIFGIISYIGIMLIIKDENLLYILKFINNKLKSKKELRELA